MKKKIIAVIVLIMMVLPMFLSLYQVKAFSGELDPEYYIYVPSTIYIEDGVGTETISLSSSAQEYNISYQKVDLTQEQFNVINNKQEEINDYVEECNLALEQMEEDLEELVTEWENLKDSETATEEEIADAKARYDEAYEEYQEYYNTVETIIETKTSEYYALIPDYTNSWTETTNTQNNVQLDFTDYSGIVNFILWVKITDGTNTYYDMAIYSDEIIEDDDEEDNNGGAGDNDEEETVTGEWTDFSNADFELKKDGTSGAILEISNVIPKEGSYYYLLITSNGNEPTVDDFENEVILTYDEENENFIVSDMEKYIELNQDLYASILEVQSYNSENVVLFGKQLERYAEPKYSDAFFATFMTHDTDQIVTTFTHDSDNNRKMQIKVGKITDTEILQKIKKQDASGFASLLSFAKSDKGIYDKLVDATKNDYAISYDAGTGTQTGYSVIDLEGVQDEAYYFLYVETYDENGKYISNEAVTLAQANVHEDGKWFLFFYGDEDFEWADFGDVEDNTKAPITLPDTGIGKYIIIISLLATVVIVSYIQVKKLKEIK